jgi:VIT1/CCC1 family predicted Fe2+/Mn2+ transporter
MYVLFEERGLSAEDAKSVVDTMAKYPEFFVDAMMHYELEVAVPGEDDNPWVDGGITLASFIIFGVVPLLGYLIFYSVPGLGSQELFVIACCLTAITLFALGAIKTAVTAQKWDLGEWSARKCAGGRAEQALLGE